MRGENMRRYEVGSGRLEVGRIVAIAIIGLMLASAFAGCVGGERGGQQQPAEKPKPPVHEKGNGWIYGKVTDKNGTGIDGAVISVKGGMEWDGRTDERGEYITDDLLPGVYNVSASAEGFSGVTKTATVLADDGVQLDFILSEAAGIIPGTGTPNYHNEIDDKIRGFNQGGMIWTQPYVIRNTYDIPVQDGAGMIFVTLSYNPGWQAPGQTWYQNHLLLSIENPDGDFIGSNVQDAPPTSASAKGFLKKGTYRTSVWAWRTPSENNFEVSYRLTIDVYYNVSWDSTHYQRAINWIIAGAMGNTIAQNIQGYTMNYQEMRFEVNEGAKNAKIQLKGVGDSQWGNNIDLEIYDPGGTKVAESKNAGNDESIDLAQLSAGKYTAKILAELAPQIGSTGAQYYNLFIDVYY